MNFFKHTKLDAFLVLQTMAAILIPFLFAISNPGLVWWVLALPVHVFLILNLQNTSLHHHTHWQTFNNKQANTLYDLLLSAAAHLPAQFYKWSHTTHHKHVNDSPVNGVCKDPMSVFARGHNGEIQNVWLFCWENMVRNLSNPYRFFLSKEKKLLKFMKPVQVRNEYAACVILQLLIFVLNPVYSLWLFFVVYALASFFNYTWHYGEHWGAHDYRGDTTKDAVGIYHKWYNLICFNSGYHQEHHHKPGVHWTKQYLITPDLPTDRVQTHGMHITNVPYWAHFKELFKS